MVLRAFLCIYYFFCIYMKLKEGDAKRMTSPRLDLGTFSVLD